MNHAFDAILSRRSAGAPAVRASAARRPFVTTALAGLLFLLLAPDGAGASPATGDEAPPSGELSRPCPSDPCLPDPGVPRDVDVPIDRDPSLPGKPGAPKPTPTPVEPRFVTYWVATPDAPGCPDGEPCLAVRASRRELLDLVPRWRRDRGLELVRFDALVGDGVSLWVGAWQRSDRRHRLELDLDWGTFRRHHRRHVEDGEELVNLKVYEVGGRQRVGAIWRTRGADDPPPARVRRAHDWSQLDRLNEEARREGYSLAEIEAFPRPDGPDDRWAAGVWRYGTVETRLLVGLSCRRGHDAPLEDQVPDPVRPGAIDAHLFSRCQLMTELAAQAKEGFQAVDFENYTEAGEEVWAVLLHRRSGPDWLQFAGTEHDVEARERSLDSGAPGAGYTLVDLDLYGLTPFPILLHNGLVHDGSTSGPP